MLRLRFRILPAILAVGCAPPAKLTVLMHFRPGQQAFFQDRILKPFEKKHNCVIEVRAYEDPLDLPELLARPGDTLDLINPPLEMTRSLAGRNLVAPLEEIVSPKELADMRKEFFLMDLGRIKDRYYFIPRYLETPLLVYLKPQVAEAVQYWELRRDEINRALMKYNGRGLPRNYQLEKDPGQWDAFDLFVAGYYWKNKEIRGQKRGRMSLGPLFSHGTPNSLMDKAYQGGAAADGILRMGDEAVLDMFQWQAAAIREGTLNPSLIRSRWSEEQTWQAFQSGELFLSEATQMEAFFIHGNGTPQLPGYLASPEDLGLSIMPRGASLQLDAQGQPVRMGRRSVATRGWWWGISRRSRDRALAYRLARYLSSTEIQIEECTAFGMIPVRQDLLGELGLMFGGGWMSEVFSSAAQQLVENRYTVLPLLEEFPEISRNYQEAFQETCVAGANRKGGFEDIGKILEERYIPRQRVILGAKYPVRALSSRTGSPTPQATND